MRIRSSAASTSSLRCFTVRCSARSPTKALRPLRIAASSLTPEGVCTSYPQRARVFSGSAIMAVVRIVFRPAGGGVALASWDEVDAKVGALLPRVHHRFGVQEVWAHARFFLR